MASNGRKGRKTIKVAKPKSKTIANKKRQQQLTSNKPKNSESKNLFELHPTSYFLRSSVKFSSVGQDKLGSETTEGFANCNDHSSVQNGGFETPKGQRYRIPKIETCPPAPRKRRLLVSEGSLAMRAVTFFAPPELEVFFIRSS